MKFKSSVDIIKTAVRMLPVTDYDDLIKKLEPHKNASANLITELVRAVNTEGQYSALKSSEFKLSKAAAALQQPFDPAEVLRRMSRKDVGMVKAAEFKNFRFSDPYKRKVIIKKTAVMNMEALIRKLAASKVPSDVEKKHLMKQKAVSRKQAFQSDIKFIGHEIAELLSSEPVLNRKYAELSKFAGVRPSATRHISVTGVLKWAQLNDRLSELMDELRLVDLTIRS